VLLQSSSGLWHSWTYLSIGNASIVTPKHSVKLGWAHGALRTTFPGDTTKATLAQVRSFAQGGSAT